MPTIIYDINNRKGKVGPINTGQTVYDSENRKGKQKDK